MLQGKNDYILSNKNLKLQKVVSIPVPLFKSIKRKYFVGQTKILKIDNGLNAWAGLVNPSGSGVNLYTNVFTISNFSNDYLTAEIWLNTKFPMKSNISNNVSPTNTASHPLPKNKVDIRFVGSTNLTPKSGVNVYVRIVPPNTTLVAEEDGKFIASPGGSYTLVIKSPNSKFAEAVVAFGWWEN